jgi:hypothetical protein
VTGLFGVTSHDTGTKKVIILVGASHARHIKTKMDEAGIIVKHIETSHWRATKQEVTKLTEDIQAVVGNLPSDKVAIILGMCNNAYYRARDEDGTLIPHRRAPDGTYHIDGDILGSPVESCKQVFSQLYPMLKHFQDIDKLLMVLLPRYLWDACCDDPQHAPNVREIGHVDTILDGLTSLQKLWRGMTFRERIRNLKICNVGHLLGEFKWWVSDPVHPTSEGYDLVTNHLIVGLTSLEEKRLQLEKEEAGISDNSKRNLDLEESAVQPSKRSTWDTDSYVTRSERGSFMQFRPSNRGGRFNGGGQRFGWFGGWPRRGGSRGNSYY